MYIIYVYIYIYIYKTRKTTSKNITFDNQDESQEIEKRNDPLQKSESE